MHERTDEVCDLHVQRRYHLLYSTLSDSVTINECDANNCSLLDNNHALIILYIYMYHIDARAVILFYERHKIVNFQIFGGTI